nr:MAG TPA: hypothetical protein [Caudoviricetes sp.]
MCLLQDGVHLCVAEALTRHQLGDVLRCRHGPLILGSFVAIGKPSHSHHLTPFRCVTVCYCNLSIIP